MRRRALLSESDPLINGYIKNGLMFYIDGIEKSYTSGIMRSLVGNIAFARQSGNISVSESSYIFDNSLLKLSIGSIADCETLEICVKWDNGRVFAKSGMGNVVLQKYTNLNNGTEFIIYKSHSTPWGGFYWNFKDSPYVCLYISPTNLYGVQNPQIIANLLHKSNTTDLYAAIAEATSIGAFTGEIYSIRMYNRKLSDSEVLSNQRNDIQRFGLSMPAEVHVIANGSGNCNGDGNYNIGDVVNLTAVPSTGSEFIGWYRNGSLLTSSLNYNLLIDDEYIAVEARFSDSNFEFVKSLHSDGAQYINTNILPNGDLKTRVRGGYLELGDGTSKLFGSRQNVGVCEYMISASQVNGRMFDFAYGSNKISGTSGMHSDTMGRFFEVDGNVNYVGRTVNISYPREEFSSRYPMYVFGANYGGTPNGLSKAFIYNFRVWSDHGDTLLIDLIPCIRSSDNEVCMYDLVSKTFFTNQGTGAFIVNPF